MTFDALLQTEPGWLRERAIGDRRVAGLTHDSRSAGPDSLFFCLPGSRYDGHDFAAEAYRRGCRCFVAERPLKVGDDAAVLFTENAEKSMARIASRYYGDPASTLTLVGITGTKGKTTTARMLVGLLERSGVSAAYIGSSGVAYLGRCYETENTTPDSLTLMRHLAMIRDAGVGTAVMEVSSQAMVRHRVFGLRFSLGVFTNLSRDHIGEGEHANMREYAAAKLSFFTECRPQTVILNGEDSFSGTILENLSSQRALLYGNCRSTALYAEGYTPLRARNRFSTAFFLSDCRRRWNAAIGFAGKHYVDNFLAALLSAGALTGRSIEELLPYADTLCAPGRCEVIEGNQTACFVIDYAHNGASLSAALRGLRPYAEGKLYCLFGAVGGRSECRRPDMARAACRYADFSVITSDNPAGEDPGVIAGEILSHFPDKRRAIVIPDRGEAIRYLLRVASPRDVVLLAGKGDEQHQVTEEGRTPFSEAEILSRFIGKNRA